MLPLLPRTHAHLKFPELDPALEPFRALLEESVKPAWLLRGQRVETVSRATTHIGGFTPYAPVEIGWPYCPACGNPLSFIWQINFAEFDAATFAAQGLFQFFYCWICFPLPGCDSYPYEKLCRWYPDFSSRDAEVPQVGCPYVDESPEYENEIYDPLRVEAVPFLSAPSPESDDNPVPEEMRCEPLNAEGETFAELYYEATGFSFDECISQVGGYPNWVQSIDETPLCPNCGQRAELVGAVGSHETDLLWGDTGYWYIFACKFTDDCPGLNKPLMASQSM